MAIDCSNDHSDTHQTQGSSSSHPKTLSEAVERLLKDFESGKRCPWSAVMDDGERFSCFKRLCEARGARYAACSIDTFQVTGGSEGRAQTAVLGDLIKFQEQMLERLRSGGGLVLYGPEGTGKDHLQFAMLRHAVLELGFTADWRDGMRLQDEIRRAIGEGKESELRRKLEAPHILAISDPLPPTGELNQWNLSFLRDVVDRRYQDRKSTWITFNGSSIDDLKPILQPPLAARILESATSLHCNWRSHRQPLRRVGFEAKSQGVSK